MNARDRFLSTLYLSITDRAGIPPTDAAKEEFISGLSGGPAPTATTRPAPTTPDLADRESIRPFNRPDRQRYRPNHDPHEQRRRS